MNATFVPPGNDSLDGSDLESLRDAFVEAFNGRDLDGVLELLADDVDLAAEDSQGTHAVANALTSMWDRSPEVVLTVASLNDQPAAVAWIRGDGEWARATVVTFDGGNGLIELLEFVEDPADVEAAVTDGPAPDEVEEEFDWAANYEGEDPADTTGEAGPLGRIEQW